MRLMQLGICSYSFHRLMACGEMDFAGYVQICKELGCTQLDPWNAHLTPIGDGAQALHAGHNPSRSQHLSAPDESFVKQIKQLADDAAMPFGTMVVDGAHIYEPAEQARRENRERAYRWLDVAAMLGVWQLRIDAGGPEEMPDDVFAIIVEGYKDLIARAQPRGIEMLIENHWGPSIVPGNIERLMAAVPGLGLLLDTRSWKPGQKEEGRRRCAKFARATHIKTIKWDSQGNEPMEDVAGAVASLKAAHYAGPWGIESVPTDGDERRGARLSVDLVRQLVNRN
jgi:sugar phosphate isomerase/epimerase